MSVPCPSCRCPGSFVVEGELRQDDMYRRRRQCRGCGHRYRTQEVLAERIVPDDAAQRPVALKPSA